MRTATSLFTTVSLLALSSALGACSATSTDPGATASSPVTSGTSPETGGGSNTFVVPPSTSGTTPTVGIDPNKGVGNAKPSDCQPKLIGRVRDFNSYKSLTNPHLDFQAFLGQGITKGLVMPTLGADGAPVYADPQPAGNPMLTTASNFKLWYSTNHPANATVELDLDNPPASANIKKSVDPNTGATTYESTNFFPIDGKGTQAEDLLWTDKTDGSDNPQGGTPHNYHFTFELNTKFIYKKKQVFSFYGDDDLWVFIDKKLAVDVGGLHSQELGQVDLDTLGLVEGKEYDLNVFHAERHTTTSNFKATTNITFSNCDAVLR